jgi:hypothetical protein
VAHQHQPGSDAGDDLLAETLGRLGAGRELAFLVPEPAKGLFHDGGREQLAVLAPGATPHPSRGSREAEHREDEHRHEGGQHRRQSHQREDLARHAAPQG